MTRRPRLTVRARLALVNTGLFAACGAVVVATSYVLVANVEGPGPPGTASEATPAKIAAVCRLAKGGSPPLVAKCNAALRQLGAQQQRELTRSHLLAYSLVTLAVAILLAAVLGWVAAGRALRPVQQIAAAARAASAQDLSARVALAGPRDELHELAATFDEMLARLEAAFESQRRFVANASHELRTPLAVIRASVDVVLGNPGSTPGDLRAMAADVRGAVDRAEQLVAALLILARTDRGLAAEERVDLATAAEDALDATAAGGRLLHTSLEPAVVSGDPVLAERLVANLVDNAVRYNVAGGEVWISTRVVAGRGEIVVENTGAPVSDADAARILLPFHRLGDERSHEGFGLGLAIVASIAAAHRGSVEAVPRDGGGLTVVVRIPAIAGDVGAARPASAAPVTSRTRRRRRPAGGRPEPAQARQDGSSERKTL